MLLNPEWNRTCADCETWFYDQEPGSENYGNRMLRNGELVPQESPPITPCNGCPKISRETKRRAIEDGRYLTSADADEPETLHFTIVYEYLKCHAVGRFPKNHWMKEFGVIIKPILTVAENRPMMELMHSLRALAPILRKLQD